MTNDKETKTDTKKTRTRKQDRDTKIQKAESTHESGQGIQQDEQQIDLTPFVSNVEGDVYAITNLPEEFIATLFAWVSRSPKSFKEHLKQAIKDFNIQAPAGEGFDGLSEKAKKFHEKWTVGYGHSSVAEHAVAHVGIEGISRLASAELELANTFLSITEYSQRYQKPERGKWHNPFSAILVGHPLNKPSLHEIVEEFYEKAFDAFENLIDGVYKHLKEDYHKSNKYKELKKRQKENDTDIDALTQIDKELKADYNALKKLAFEDARYVLPLAMHTQMGMTANGRAWRDAIAFLGNSDHVESRKLSHDLRTEITKVLPVLLKYAEPSQYQVNSKKRMKPFFKNKNTFVTPRQDVQLHAVSEELTVINHLVATLAVRHSDVPYANALVTAKFNMTLEQKEQLVRDLLFEMKHFDMAPPEFNHIRYSADFLVSEANWHQLLRHNRKTDFTFSNPSPAFGIKIPPRIVEAGLTHLLKDIAVKAEELYNKLVELGCEKEAEYVVLNAHKRLVHADFSLMEAYHLINLRTSEEAQWDIRETFEELYKQMHAVHPLLVSQAKRRL